MENKEIVEKALTALRESSAEFKAAAIELKGSRGFFAILKTAGKVIPPLVREIEANVKALGPEIAGAKKRELVLEGIMSLLPPLPWWAPEWLVRKLLGRAIDLAVAELNKRLGKNW